MENNEYSKFKSLNYEKNCDFKEFWEKNEYTKDIFENSRLFAQNYKYFNDIDECVYLISLSIDEEVINNISHGKEERVICCFSSREIIGTDGEKLMWAHYANSSKGIRIDFTIDREFEKYVKKVEHKPNIYFENNKELVKEFNNGLDNIMCRKSEAWKYEKEHRAIFSKYDSTMINYSREGAYFFPIKIEGITFGRGCGFFPNKELNNPELEKENARKHILKIASFIYKVLEESGKYNSSQDSSSDLPNLPRFSYYEDKYSLQPVEIPKEELKKLTKLQDKIQSLEQEIVDLKNRINNPIIRSTQTPTESPL